LRLNYPKFTERDCEIVNLGPDKAAEYRAYWQKHEMPFVGLADPKHVAAKAYGQPVRLLKLGRMPMQLLVDREGVIRYFHESTSMSDIPHDDVVLSALDAL